jgi:hypothetical protein
MLSPMFLLPVEEQHRVDDSFYRYKSIKICTFLSQSLKNEVLARSPQYGSRFLAVAKKSKKVGTSLDWIFGFLNQKEKKKKKKVFGGVNFQRLCLCLSWIPVTFLLLGTCSDAYLFW